MIQAFRGYPRFGWRIAFSSMRPFKKGRKRPCMHSIAWWPTLIVLAIATFTDLRSRRIPNWLVLPFMAGGICVSGWQHGWGGIRDSPACLVGGALLYRI